MTHTYKKANIIVVFVEILLRAELLCIEDYIFEKLSLKPIFQILYSMQARSCARQSGRRLTGSCHIELYLDFDEITGQSILHIVTPGNMVVALDIEFLPPTVPKL